MCLEAKTSEKLIAQEDILCYKALTFDLRAVNNGYNYELGRTNPTVELGIYPSHSGYIRVEQGYHSFVKKEDAFNEARSSYYRPVLCKIPKGTAYIKGRNNGETDGYVAETIVVVKKYSKFRKFIFKKFKV